MYTTTEMVLLNTLPLIFLILEWICNRIYIEHHLLLPTLVGVASYGVSNVIASKLRRRPIYDVFDYETAEGYFILLCFCAVAVLLYYVMLLLNDLKFRKVLGGRDLLPLEMQRVYAADVSNARRTRSQYGRHSTVYSVRDPEVFSAIDSEF